MTETLDLELDPYNAEHVQTVADKVFDLPVGEEFYLKYKDELIVFGKHFERTFFCGMQFMFWESQFPEIKDFGDKVKAILQTRGYR